MNIYLIIKLLITYRTQPLNGITILTTLSNDCQPPTTSIFNMCLDREEGEEKLEKERITNLKNYEKK